VGHRASVIWDSGALYRFGFRRRLSQCLNPRIFLMCSLYSPARRSLVIRWISTVTSAHANRPRPKHRKHPSGLSKVLAVLKLDSQLS